MNAREDALRRTSAAAGLFEVSEERVAQLGARLTGPSVARAIYAAGYLHHRLLDAAEEHRKDCGGAACATCEHFGEAVAMMLAFVRAELDDEFREQMAPRRRRWLRRWASHRSVW
ncbi:hypothetical protein [Actinoplanes sp. NPDC051859]|uniref:hypothetical protein n=1 Tax=Actinoplanes sp. NPDC051859 TaxID=3363909 RepID=UPI0037A6BDE7